MNGDIRDEISDFYLTTYNTKLEALKTATTRVAKDVEQIAQKYAIKLSAITFFKKYPDWNKSELWNLIYSAHVARKSGIDVTRETIIKVISADQSWKKSSGHAFEEMVRDIITETLEVGEVSILLQREMLLKIRAGEIKNDPRDLEWIESQMHSDVFDLYMVGDGYIFGCVQAKTSVRDRVTRDREPSMNAMSRFLWSIAFVLDGGFLKLPKFKAMVNGDTVEFQKNGWHGLYAFSLPEGAEGGRIYRIESDTLEPIKSHIQKAYSDWKTQRQWFNADWKADNQ